MDKGFVKAPNALVRDPSLSATAKVAWLLIAGMPDGYHPTREQWMAMLRIKDKRAWFRVVKELDAAGLIEVETFGARRFYKAIEIGVENAPIMVRNPHPDGCVKRTVLGAESSPYKKNIEEQEKNNSAMRARLREEVMIDMMVEMGCRSCGITPDQYIKLADEILNDWEFEDIPGSEWTKKHFLGVMRIKAKELKRNAVHQQRKTTVTGPISGATQGENPLAGFPTYTKTGS